MILPSLSPELIPPGVRPVLFFVNVKSGGCQGLELITSFRRMVNPSQVFDLDNGGPLPGSVNTDIRVGSHHNAGLSLTLISGLVHTTMPGSV